MTGLLLLDLVLKKLGLDLEVAQLLAQALRFDAKLLTLLLAYLDLLLHHDRPLNSLVVLGFHILQR
jgi:uncharacterized protein YybS (DUF2232 family)